MNYSVSVNFSFLVYFAVFNDHVSKCKICKLFKACFFIFVCFLGVGSVLCHLQQAVLGGHSQRNEILRKNKQTIYVFFCLFILKNQ